MKKKSGSNILVRKTGKIDFTFFNFLFLHQASWNCLQIQIDLGRRFRGLVQNTTYYRMEKKDLPTDKFLILQRKLYLKAKVQLAYDTFAKYTVSMSGIMSGNKKRSHGKPD